MIFDMKVALLVREDLEVWQKLNVVAMFAIGHDGANREALRAEPADSPDLVRLALRAPKKDVERATKGLTLHL